MPWEAAQTSRAIRVQVELGRTGQMNIFAELNENNECSETPGVFTNSQQLRFFDEI